MAKSIKLNKDLWQRVEQHAKNAGYSSPEEFIEHVIEKELNKQEEDDSSKDEVARRLKGLGYLE
jgi:metal-responsive CopG/Arc/MetJ family transcriptional regulator